MTLTKMFHSVKRFTHTGEQVIRKKFPWIIPNGDKTNIVVYNPIARRKTPLIVKNNVLTWYMCGPTVYDSCHIGHAW